MVKNKFRVPQRQWKRWTEAGQTTFNHLFEIMKNNQKLFLHPMQEALTSRKWSTVCWNASWIAADGASGHVEDYAQTRK